MAFTKITSVDVADKGVIGLPNKPNMTTHDIQVKFDELALDVLMPKHNGLIDELEAGAAGASIGVMDGETETNLQDRLDGIEGDIPTKVSDLENDSAFISNGIKTITIGETDIEAEGEDAIEIIAGDNVTLTPDAENKTITIASTGGGGGASSADDVSYDNTTSGLTATNVQDAIDEVYGDMPTEPTVYTQTLVAGNTSVAFTDVETTANSVVEVGTSVAGLDYNSISVSGTTYTVSFDTQASNVTVYLIVSEI